MGEDAKLPAHSPLGASGAYRWMACPGSVSLSRGIVDEESEHASLGTAAHTLGEHCLTHKEEPWRYIGWAIDKDEGLLGRPGDVENAKSFGQIIVDKDMADAVQAYVTCINQWHGLRHQGNSWVERKFHCPDIHDAFYGTSDFVALTEKGEEYIDNETGEVMVAKWTTLDVWDYKHGVGIVVEAIGNPQLPYYAAGVLSDLDLWDKVDKVRLHIFQPRGWHWKGPHRYTEMTCEELDEWVGDVCIPAMDRALVSRDTNTGEHCRFCPARAARCPAIVDKLIELQELLEMAEKRKEGSALPYTNEQLGHLMALNELNKIVQKAIGKEAHGRLTTGQKIPGVKLVNSRTNRQYKDGAEEEAAQVFGDRCMDPPRLKSPAQLDGLPGGKKFTARWAFKPEGGTTIAMESDNRRALKRDPKALFKPVAK